MSWRFSDFYDRYNQWVDQDDPPSDFRFWVMAWLFRLQEDPKTDAAPAEELGEPWWFCKIPNAEDDSHGVVCLYSIEDDQRSASRTRRWHWPSSPTSSPRPRRDG